MAVASTETVPSRVFSQELPKIFADYLDEWMKGSAPITILVTGKEGAGRSSLINALLGITRVPERERLLKPKTTEIRQYNNLVGPIQVTAWDTPGLGKTTAGDKIDPNNIANIEKHCKDIDLILYCVDMSVVRYDESQYASRLKELSVCLGDSAFKKTMVVLTYANRYIMQTNEEYAHEPEAQKRDFLKTVETWERKLKSTLRKECKVDEKILKKLKVIPAGSQQNPHLFEEDPTWLSKLWLEAITVNPGVLITPSVTKLYSHQLSRSDRNEISVDFTLQLREDFSITC